MMQKLQTTLPVTNSLSNGYTLSVILTVLMAAVSLVGLFFPTRLYLTPASDFAFRTNDLINLLIGLPALLGSLWFVRREKLIGLLFWPGALLYVLYTYIAYLVGVPVGVFSLVYGVLVLLSLYLLFDVIKKINKGTLQSKLKGMVREKLSGVVLIVFGITFFALAVGVVSEANTSQLALVLPDVGVALADLVLSILLVGGGLLLVLRKPLGYVGGLGLLFAAVLLFIAVMMVVLIRPLFWDVIFSLEDFVVLFFMALICFIPFGFFVRGVLSVQKETKTKKI